VSCGTPEANYFGDPGCNASCGTQDQPIATTCTPLAVGTCGGTHVTISASVASGGSCAPDAGSQIAPAAWTAGARLCAATGAPSPAGCDAGEVCAPATGLPFEPSTYCIARSGVATCPAGYPVQHTYYESSADTRACTPCSCGAPSGSTCTGGGITVYGGAMCSGGSTQLAVPQTCAALGGSKVGIFSGATAAGGSCAPSGGQPTGAFTPTTPTTICCTQ
jgi:hypothetical protein